MISFLIIWLVVIPVVGIMVKGLLSLREYKPVKAPVIRPVSLSVRKPWKCIDTDFLDGVMIGVVILTVVYLIFIK